MANTPVVVLDDTLTNIADAIRSKTGGTATMTPGQMSAQIASIPSGGGGVGIPLSVSQTGALTRSTDSFVFTTPPEATRIEYHGSKGLYGLQYAFYSCQGLTGLDLSSVTEVIGSDALLKCFYSCRNLVSVDFSGLEIINGSGALNSAFQYCSALTSVDFCVPILFRSNFS